MTGIENADMVQTIYNVSEACIQFASQELENIRTRKAKFKTPCNISPFLFGFCVLSKLAHVRCLCNYNCFVIN